MEYSPFRCLILDSLGPQNYESIQFCCFKPPSFRSFAYSRPRHSYTRQCMALHFIGMRWSWKLLAGATSSGKVQEDSWVLPG